MGKKIFFAAPFHSYMEYKNGKMHDNKIRKIKTIVKFLRDKGHEVHNAHEREKWGEDWYAPEDCTPLDFENIKDSELLIAIPGNPPSGGVHIELGWASALNKTVIILLEPGKIYSNLILGLGELTLVKFIYYRTLDEVTSKLDEILEHEIL